MKIVLKGIIPPMVTPLTAEGELDVKGLERLIEHLISGGVHGIFLLGSTGEAPSLTYELRKELITKACEYIANRVTVLVGITDTSFQGSLDIAEHAKNAGVDAVVIASPYYFPISEFEMIEYLECLVPKLPLPFVMYNIPSCTKLHLSVDTIRRAKQLGGIGIKDSSGNLNYLYTLIEEFKPYPDFAVIAGTESFLPKTIAKGGNGVIAGGANFFPRLFVDLYDACVRNDIPTITALEAKVDLVQNTIYKVGKYDSAIIKGIKGALKILGICDDHMALPLRRFETKELDRIKAYIKGVE